MTAAPPKRTLTRQAVLDDLTARFRAAGLETPLADARLLLSHALAVDRLALHTDPRAQVSDADVQLIESYACRHLAHKPVSRIVGERWFYGRPFRVTPATLDPRPDTETIIDAVKTLFAENGRQPRRILDIGTGTGCILLTLLAEFPEAVGLGTDISAEALAVARQNAADLGLIARSTFAEGADFGPASVRFDLIVSNPPYIPSAAIAHLDPEVRDFDPLAALDGGPDGLAIYRRIAEQYSRYLSGGWIVLEVGHDQAAAVADLFRRGSDPVHPPEIRTYADLGRIARCVAINPRPVASC